MKILVTGTDGYIGVLLAPSLRDRGHEVVGLDTGFYRDGCLYDLSHALPTAIHQDTRRVTVEDLAGFDAVVHLAELCNDPLGELNPELTYRVNPAGTGPKPSALRTRSPRSRSRPAPERSRSSLTPAAPAPSPPKACRLGRRPSGAG